MATDPSGQAPDAIPRHPILSRVRLIFTLALVALLAVCLVVSWTTRDAMRQLSFLKAHDQARGLAGGQNTLVDLSPWQTAQALAGMAVSTEEVEYAHEAERLADHEVDQAFASALRQASMQQHTLTPEAVKLSQKVAQLEQIVKQDQAHVQSLTKTANLTGSSATNPAAPAAVADDLDVAKAQLGLDSDELADAQQDLARAAGDESTRIKQELAAHESLMKKYDAQSRMGGEVAVVSTHRYGTLFERLKAWMDQRTRDQSIQQAMQQAKADAIALTAQHNQRQSQANTAASAATGNSSQPDANPASGETSANAARVASLKNRATLRQVLSIYDDRIQTEQQLASVYGKWSAQVLLQHRILLHLLLQSIALIAFILICVILLDALVRHLVNRRTLDGRRTRTLRTIIELVIQCIGVLLILLVIFGAPRQMPTILGLTTAGLTVALQDFILAFLGWWVLMGKNGIHVGDWVEINGVSGEVVEVGLFRTAMLETGNWADKGHPTGRRVTFINNFAINGRYFNFSTSGQWMWDEIRLSVPADSDVYAAIELVRKAVLEATKKDVHLAEQEWKRATKQNRLSEFNAEPSVDMRPGAYGIDIIVRYITRAANRFEVRNRLYQCVIDLLHNSPAPQPQLDQPPVIRRRISLPRDIGADE